MRCTISGIFYIHNIHDKYLDCIFIDEYEESHQLSILHYHNHKARDGPFPEISQYVTSGHVYILHGTMTVIDEDYLHPSVWFHFLLFSLQNTYVWIDAGYELLSTISIYIDWYFSVLDYFCHRFNVSDASHGVSYYKDCQVDFWIQEWRVQKGISSLEILCRWNSTICWTGQCTFLLYISLIHFFYRPSISNYRWT